MVTTPICLLKPRAVKAFLRSFQSRLNPGEQSQLNFKSSITTKKGFPPYTTLNASVYRTIFILSHHSQTRDCHDPIVQDILFSIYYSQSIILHGFIELKSTYLYFF